MCKSNEELVNHLFVHCHYAREVSFEAILLSNGNNKWERDSLLSCFKSLYKDKFVKARKALSYFLLWYLYLTRNYMTFQGKDIHPPQVSRQIRYACRGSWKPKKRVKPSCILKKPKHDKSNACFFL